MVGKTATGTFVGNKCGGCCVFRSFDCHDWKKSIFEVNYLLFNEDSWLLNSFLNPAGAADFYEY